MALLPMILFPQICALVMPGKQFRKNNGDNQASWQVIRMYIISCAIMFHFVKLLF